MKFFIILSFLLIMTGCNKIPKKVWNMPNKKILYLDLKPGDIIVKEKEKNLLGLFGHVGIMKTDRFIVDYPKLGERISLSDINLWLEKNRKFIVLRYKNMNSDFQNALISKLNYYINLNKKYSITFAKNQDEYFYCSQFIWYLYYQTGLKFGLSLNLDSDNGPFIFPYDFIFSNELYIVLES